MTLLSGNKTRTYQRVLRVLKTNPLDVHLDLLYKQWHVPLEAMLVYVHIILDSSCAGMKTKPDRGASVHTKEWWLWHDFCDGAKPWKLSITIGSVPHFGTVWMGIRRTIVEVNKSEWGLESNEMEVNIQEWGLGFSLANPLGQPLWHNEALPG